MLAAVILKKVLLAMLTKALTEKFVLALVEKLLEWAVKRSTNKVDDELLALYKTQTKEES